MVHRSFLTLFLVLAIAHFAPVAVPGANALQGMNLAPPAAVRRAEHHQMAGRMIKKRQATGRPTDTDTNTPSNTGTPSGSGGSAPSGPTNTGTTTPPPSQTSNTNTNTRTSNSSSSSSSSSSSAPTSTPSATPSAPTSTPSNSSSNSSRRTSTLTQTQTSAGASQTNDQSSNPDASFLPKPVIIGLIVTGSCIAAAAAIWTIIRKWKFSPSRHFEDRLEPINWEPTQSSGLPHDPTVAALARGGSQNGGSQNGRTRNSLGSDEQGSVRNMSTVNKDQISMAPDFPPPHDFTAGPAGLAPGGYVDMYRGPSPGPNPYGQRGVSPAPSAPYGQQYETPNPYDAYDYNSGYGQRRY